MRAQLERDFIRFRGALPPDLAGHVRATYRIDLSTRYLGLPVAHPVGKGSGQLSLREDQLVKDAAAGLAFVVLKTVIAEDPDGRRGMAAWAVPESRMAVEPIRSREGREGWTVTWQGRGWDRSLEAYLALLRAGRDLTRGRGMPVVPSVKYHLPGPGEAYREAEYVHTTAQLADAWGPGPLYLEKDFSPTLAGDALAAEREQVLRWVREVPGHIRAAAPHGAVIGLKLMNARFDDAFQADMLATAAGAGADGLVVFNRLFDPARGVAYGGWDLSDRNLRVLAAAPRTSRAVPSLIGTGNVCSGRMIAEYARLGCECVQVHTFFQLPLSAYPATAGGRTQRALHALVFDPRDGLIAVLLELEEQGILQRSGRELRFRDLIGIGCAAP